MFNSTIHGPSLRCLSSIALYSIICHILCITGSNAQYADINDTDTVGNGRYCVIIYEFVFVVVGVVVVVLLYVVKCKL